MMLSLTGPAGRTYDLQASENLQDWTVIGVVTVGSGGALGFTDPEASNFPQRFYRARETQPTVRLGVSPAGQAELRIAGQNNHTYAIQASSNLSDWTVIGTVTVDASGAVGFTDPEAADQPARFYRTQDMTN